MSKALTWHFHFYRNDRHDGLDGSQQHRQAASRRDSRSIGGRGSDGLGGGTDREAARGRVVGIAGSDEKCEWLRSELGFDAALNYKKESFRKDLAEATPDFIDVYWDNVGGEILEAALNRAKFRARFVMCGSISGYNAAGKETAGIRNLSQVVAQRIRMEGFIVFDFASDYPRASEEIAQWLAEGKIKRKETIVKGGIEKAEFAIRDSSRARTRASCLSRSSRWTRCVARNYDFALHCCLSRLVAVVIGR